MKPYAVLLHEPNAEAVKRIKSKYKSGVYEFSDTSLLVKTVDLAEDVAVAAGIKGGQRVANGVVSS